MNKRGVHVVLVVEKGKPIIANPKPEILVTKPKNGDEIQTITKELLTTSKSQNL